MRATSQKRMIDCAYLARHVFLACRAPVTRFYDLKEPDVNSVNMSVSTVPASDRTWPVCAIIVSVRDITRRSFGIIALMICTPLTRSVNEPQIDMGLILNSTLSSF